MAGALTTTSFQRARVGFIEGASGTGLQVTSNSNMVPSVAAGNYWLGGRRVVYAGGTVTIGASSASRNRIDVIVMNDSGTASVVAGTSATPGTEVAPVIPTDVMPIARVLIAANDVSIDAADITDLRDFGGFTVDGTSITISANGVLSVVGSAISGIPVMVASGHGTTSLTGDGTAQTVFTDTFTALSDGDLLVASVKVQFNRTAGAGTSALAGTVGGTTFFTHTAADTEGDILWVRASKNSVSASRGFIITESVQNGGTGTAAQNILVDTMSLNAALNSITVTANTAAATNGNYAYTYHVMKYPTGV